MAACYGEQHGCILLGVARLHATGRSMHAHCTPAHYCRLLDHLGDKCPKTINLMWPNTVYTAHINIAAGGLQFLVRYKNQLYFKLIIFQRKTLKKKQKNNSTNHFENSIYIIIYTKFRIETILPPNPK